ICGDIRLDECKAAIPEHDILCAGFPCQPFSKSGQQLGLKDLTRGTIFNHILDVVERHHPQYVVLENVGNFEHHDGGRTWQIVRESLQSLGYAVRGTEHVASGGPGLLSPHHLGFPHSRERFFIVAKLGALPANPFPARLPNAKTSLASIAQPNDELTEHERTETALQEHRVRCIDHWNKLLASIPADAPLPSFPIWSDEFGATYPYKDTTPYASPPSVLRAALNGHVPLGSCTKADLLTLLPSYARTEALCFPTWKEAFIRQNREWYEQHKEHITTAWLEELRTFASSHRKLEWNCKGEERDLWKHVLQFRPSGLRVKRYTTSPSLVAMTDTQVPVLGPQRRFLTRKEGLRLQGFPDDHKLPAWRERAFQALGNAVHVGVVELVVSALTATQQLPLEFPKVHEKVQPDAEFNNPSGEDWADAAAS
ncbi:MAG: DNA cytosine methyltransferase, partial [Chloroflexota bacterium]